MPDRETLSHAGKMAIPASLSDIENDASMIAK
jgi:hypothetical protein